MESRASYVLVGLFMVALIAGGIFFALWLVGQQETDGTDAYRVHFRDSVTGLIVGADVRYRGIPVGRINSIDFHPTNTDIIEVGIELGERTPVTRVTRARIEVQGLAGQPFIQLYEPDQTAMPQECPRGPEVRGDDPRPIICGEPSQLDQIFESVPRAVDSFRQLTERLDRLLADNEDDINDLLSNANNAATQFERLAAEIQPLVGDLRRVVPDARNALQEFARTNNEMQALIAENRRPIQDFTSTGLYEVVQFLTETRQFLDTTTRILQRLESDPSRFLFGNRQQGYRP